MWEHRLTPRTPVDGLYLCGAATHPGGSVIALNGRNAAMAVLEDRNSARLMPDVTVPGGASAPELRAHLAIPPTAPGPWPGVVVVHEIFGLNADIREQAAHLAAAGFLALAVDLYSAGGAVRCIRSVFRSLTRESGPAIDDIVAARAWPRRPCGLYPRAHLHRTFGLGSPRDKLRHILDSAHVFYLVANS